MPQTNPVAARIHECFIQYCQNKNYTVQSKEDTNNDWTLDISNVRERTLVIIYHTGSIVVGGKNNILKEEFTQLKQKFDSNPTEFLSIEMEEIKPCSTRYDILLADTRGKIREGLSEIEGHLEIKDAPSSSIEYRGKITKNSSSLTFTQFKNGTLLLQGKTEMLFNETCDFIEIIANPSEKNVIARFISSDEENLRKFTEKYTPALLDRAEKNVKEKIGDVYEYLLPHDQKWFVASECLCLTQIPLPEFSPLVMPASKAFEGFCKKLLVGIGLVKKSHFKSKNANFSALYDPNNPKRKTICKKEKYVDTMLKKISLCLDENRNFMMHSDESKITKVDSAKEAEEKVNDIFKDAREIFSYFNDLYKLLPQ